VKISWNRLFTTFIGFSWSINFEIFLQFFLFAVLLHLTVFYCTIKLIGFQLCLLSMVLLLLLLLLLISFSNCCFWFLYFENKTFIAALQSILTRKLFKKVYVVAHKFSLCFLWDILSSWFNLMWSLWALHRYTNQLMYNCKRGAKTSDNNQLLIFWVGCNRVCLRFRLISEMIIFKLFLITFDKSVLFKADG